MSIHQFCFTLITAGAVMTGNVCMAAPDAIINPAKPVAAEALATEKVILTDAPNVPPPIARQHSAKVVVNLEVKEVTQRLADGVDYVFWTFGGSVPGKF